MSLSATRSPLLVTDPPPERGRSAAPGANQADTARAQASHARFANTRRMCGHARAALLRGHATSRAADLTPNEGESRSGLGTTLATTPRQCVDAAHVAARSSRR